MSRESVEKKIINGSLYYTSTYFANEVFVNKRGARAFLKTFKSIDGHSNPRLYDKVTMDKAITAYKKGNRTKEIYEQKRLEILMNEEKNRTKNEQELFLEYMENQPYMNEESLREEEGEKIINYALSRADNIFEKELPIMMLKHLLHLHGYEFNETLYRKDLELHEISESFREPGNERTIEHIESVKRLESTHGYLKIRKK